MSEKFKQVAYGGQREQVFLGEEITQRRDYSETTAHEVDKETHKILSEAYEHAQDVLSEHRDGLDRLVEVLLEDEVVSGDTFQNNYCYTGCYWNSGGKHSAIKRTYAVRFISFFSRSTA